MGMNIPTGDGDDHPVMSAINTTPLVDVMLVLLIIFLITVPVITKTVNLDLPKATNIATQTKPENITVAIDRQGNVYWKEARVPDNQVLADLIRSAAITVPIIFFSSMPRWPFSPACGLRPHTRIFGVLLVK